MPSNDGDKDEIRKADSTVKMKLMVMVNSWVEGMKCVLMKVSGMSWTVVVKALMVSAKMESDGEGTSDTGDKDDDDVRKGQRQLEVSADEGKW